MAVVDDINATLSDRELLILLNERLTNLNVKLDELKDDNVSKYECTRDELKQFREQYQNDMNRINHKFSMVEGALTLISLIIAILTLVNSYFN